MCFVFFQEIFYFIFLATLGGVYVLQLKTWTWTIFFQLIPVYLNVITSGQQNNKQLKDSVFFNNNFIPGRVETEWHWKQHLDLCVGK